MRSVNDTVAIYSLASDTDCIFTLRSSAMRTPTKSMKLFGSIVWMWGYWHAVNAQCTVYPLADPITATAIHITDVNMECLADNLFKDYTLLTELILRNVSITTAQCGAFAGAPIEVLNLSDNELSVVPNLTCLAGTLTQLLLDGNEHISIPDEIFSSLSVLNVLHLDRTLLTDFDCANLAGTSVTDIYLSQNEMTELPAFDCMEANQLTRLDVPHNRISRISPDAVSGLIHLNHLSVENNKLTSLAALTNLTNLRIIHAGRNNISDLEFIFVGSNLSNLVLEENPLVDIEGQFVNATINSLTLTSTPIVNAAGICNIYGLETIFMRSMTSLRCLPTVTPSTPFINMIGTTAHCDCCWSWVQGYRATNFILPPTCSGPAEWNGTALTSVPQENLTCPVVTAAPMVSTVTTAISRAESTSQSSRELTTVVNTLFKSQAPTEVDQTTIRVANTAMQTSFSRTDLSEPVPSSTPGIVASPAPDWNNSGSHVLAWNTWTTWTSCTVSCGGGQQFSILLCDSVRVSVCNRMLHATNNITIYYTIGGRECGLNPCPVHGYWLDWNAWEECSSVCGTGTRQRRRVCRDPENDGHHCEGSSLETDLCMFPECEVSYVTKEDLLPTPVYTAADKRPSAQGIGATYIIVLTLLAVTVLLLDLPTFYTHLRWCSRPLKSESKSKK